MTRHPGAISARLQLHEWASLRSELIWIYDREVRPRYLAGVAESKTGHRIWLIRRGSISLRTGSRTVVAGPGNWVLPGDDFRGQVFSPRAAILSVHFICQWPTGENLLTLPKTIVARNPADGKLERAAKNLEILLRGEFPEESRREQHYNSQLSDYEVFNRFQVRLLNWLAAWFHFCLANGGQPTRLTSGDARPFQIARSLNQAALDQPFPAPQLQRAMGLGLARLNQIFYGEFKITMRRFWDRRRLDFAQLCLETSSMSIKEISYRLNFRSDSHFVVWFQRLAQARPRDYRRAHLRPNLSAPPRGSG